MKLTTESIYPLSTSNNQKFHDWSKKWDDGKKNYGNGICINGNDSFYITGNSYSQKSEALIIQYDKLGNVLWEHKWGDQVYCTAIAMDNQSNLYIVGRKFTECDSFTGRCDIDFMLIKFNSSNQEQWRKEWGPTGHDMLNGITVDSLGNIYVVGESDNSVILQKYKTNGILVWERSWIAYSSYLSGKVAIDSADNIYVTGITDRYQDINGNTNKFKEIYLTKYNGLGGLIWYKTFGATNLSVLAFDIVVDHNDSIYVCGNLEKLSLSVPGAQDHDVFIAKFNNSGLQVWNETWGGSSSDYGKGIDVDSNGNIYITGCTASFGYEDLFVLKYSSEGIKKWSNVLDFSVVDCGNDIIIDSSDDIYVVGNTFNFDNDKDILVVKLGSIPPPQNQIPGYEIIFLLLISNITFIILGIRKLNSFKKKH